MKLFKNLLAIGLATSLSFALFSCNNADKDKDEKKAADTTAKTVTAPVFTPFKVMIIEHTVKDFGKWKTAYLAHDSTRQAFGISQYILARGKKDSNDVVVIDKFSDVAKAKEFGASPNLKEAMQKAGVTGQPNISLVELVRNDDTSRADLKDHVLIMHKVKDYDTWLKAYDAEGKATRAANGLIDRSLGRGVDDPNMLYIVFAISDMAKANARMQSPELKKIMTEAGVISAPKSVVYTTGQ